MGKKRKRKLATKALAVAVAVSMLPGSAITAFAETGTGTEPGALAIGHPTFKNTESLADVYDLGGVTYDSKEMMKALYQQDLDNGGDSFYMDRILARYGVANGNAGNNGDDDGNTFMTRGRALYMYTSNPAIIGFGGKTSYGCSSSGSSLGGDMYAINFSEGSSTLSSKEVTSKRVNYPSNWVSQYQVGSLTADVEKFISNENVAVTTVNLTNTEGSDKTITVNVNSNFVSSRDEVTVGGETQQELTGSMNSTADLTKITTRLSGNGFEYAEGSNKSMVKTVTIPAGQTVEVKVVMAFTTEELPQSTTDYVRFLELDGTSALKAQKAEYNQYWADNLPYIDVPNKAVQKAIDYRWWLERFNTMDANIPGYDFQYPVTVEGVLGYNNAIALTQPMHLQDTKWLRNAYLPLGQLLSVGNSSQSSAFLDNPGNRSNWNNHYGQYIADAGLEAFNVIGGGAELAENLAYYFEHDAKGQLDHYGNHTSATTPENYLIDYQNNYMTGNDADTISMHVKGIGNWKTHGENAYVYAAAQSASDLYGMLGNIEKSEEMKTLAENIQSDILEYLWCDQCQKFETRAVSPTSSFVSHNPDKPNLVELTESNNYNYFSVGAVPTDEASIAKYKEALKTFTNGDDFPIFPYYTANQVHNKQLPGSNNFSNINFTVQARAYEAALRTYDVEQEYVTDDMLALMVEWCAWNMYPNGGDIRYPNNNEFFNIDNKTLDTYYRSWIYHNILGNYTYLFIEDMAGVQPRSDEKLELDPIDFSYDHFMVNNIRYHGKDITISWDKPDGNKYYGDNVPEGFAVWIDGESAFVLNDLVHVVYDAKTGELEFPENEKTTVLSKASVSEIPAAMDVAITDSNVVEMLKKSGINGLTNEAEGATVTASYTPAKARAATWAEKHRADGSDTTSKAVNETAPDPQAVTDGMTVNMPFWGNDQSTNATDSLVIDLGGQKNIDMMDIYFYNDRQSGGYAEPTKYTLEYWDGSAWKHAENQNRTPAIPRANYNEDKFKEITTDKVRVTVTNQPGRYTAVTEVQLFKEGGDRPEVENQAPDVTVKVNTEKLENMKASLIAQCTDDGLPYDKTLTYKWEVTEKPSDTASAYLSDEKALNTSLIGSEEGTYKVRFTADDGEKQTVKELSVEIKKADTQADIDVAPTAVASSDYTASWEKLDGINNTSFEPTKSAGGTGKGWGNWGVSGGTGSTHWVQYTWKEPVNIYKNDIYWYDDNGGTRVPSSIQIQYKNDAGEWVDANVTTDFQNANKKNKYNAIDMVPVTTTALRMNMKLSAAGTGIYRWKVYSTPVEEILPVFKGTKTGTIPEMPKDITAKTSYKELRTVKVLWDAITQDQVAADGEFTINGVNEETGKFVTATITARSDMDKATITTVDDTTVNTLVGNLPYMPKTVMVLYNNGVKDNVSVNVTWPQITSDQVAAEGTFTVEGDVEGTTTKAKMTVNVIGTTVDTTKLSEALNKAKGYAAKDYTAESFKKLTDAITAAEELLKDSGATQAQINKALDDLNTAVSGLVGLKTQLESTLKEAKAFDSAKYTEESYAVLSKAITDAEEIMKAEDATEAGVNAAVEALKTAMAQLVKIENAELILHYTFDKQDEITKIKDESASNYTVEVPKLEDVDFVEGKSGDALKFDGDDTSFEIPAGANLATKDITISYWFKRTGEITGNNSLIWAKDEASYNGKGFYTNYPVGDQYSSFFVVDGFNAFYVAQNPNDFLPLNEWTHIAVTWDSDSKTGKIYKNGQEQKVTKLGDPQTITGSESAVNRVGKNGYSNDAQYPTNLELDDLRIYNGAVNSDKVNELYTEFDSNVDKSALQQALETAEAYIADGYTEESFAVLQAAITEAKVVYEDVNADQDAVDEQIGKLAEAIAQLESILGDLTQLQSLYNAVSQMDMTNYTEASAGVLKTALENAAAIIKKENATKVEAAAAESELLVALAGLEKKVEEPKPVIDKSLAKALYGAYKDLNLSGYTQESAAAFTQALGSLQTVIGKENATQEEVDNTVANLLSAATALAVMPEDPEEPEVEVDFSVLSILYNAYTGIDTSKYTKESTDAFLAALQGAEEVLNKKDAEQAAVDQAASALAQAAAELTLEPVKPEEPEDPEEPTVTTDTTTLKVLYHAYAGLDTGKYTDNSAKALKDAVSAAAAVLNNANATQDQIDQAASRLMSAATALEMKPVEIPKPVVPALKKGQILTYKGLRYQVTNPTAGKATVMVVGASSRSVKKVTVPSTVTLKGVKCKVTKIGQKSFKNYKKLQQITIGANVTAIGQQAFYGDTKLTTINVKSKVLKNAYSYCLKNISSKAVINVPKSKVKAYKKIFKNRGQKSSVVIK